MLKSKKIYLAGHKGLVGSAVLRRLKFFGYKNIVTADRRQLDLTDQKKVLKFLKKKKTLHCYCSSRTCWRNISQ